MAERPVRRMRSAPVVRTCVGCRERAVKSELLRIVAAGDEVVPDPLARLPGRGAYLHPSPGCFERAQLRRAIPRALRVPGPLGTDWLARYLSGMRDDDGRTETFQESGFKQR